ncbi:hypothetical protein ROJ8625_03597 [Roseivivax jejudonensis]|uniref:Uncharacterized protein n=1 Tax=Roseivivax jejudonensis TaxID=1529041 RepID=A0A1X7A3K2_9RHOB|nr:hypothetical protein ROJ8625_03597 [Roseivivax jejudonensis]
MTRRMFTIFAAALLCLLPLVGVALGGDDTAQRTVQAGRP